eukprot:6198796-Pleurochrysis_carterae.AAC.1
MARRCKGRQVWRCTFYFASYSMWGRLLELIFSVSAQVRSRVVVGADGRKTGYIKLSEFSAEVKPRMREALAELQARRSRRIARGWPRVSALLGAARLTPA